MLVIKQLFFYFYIFGSQFFHHNFGRSFGNGIPVFEDGGLLRVVFRFRVAGTEYAEPCQPIYESYPFITDMGFVEFVYKYNSL